MENKYKSAGLDYNLIIDKYPNIQEYEEIVNTYLSDPFFKEIGDYLNNEDYALAKDATKGLYILASELCLYNLYMAILEIYDDLESEDYSEVLKHYKEMLVTYKKVRGAFHV